MCKLVALLEGVSRVIIEEAGLQIRNKRGVFEIGRTNLREKKSG
jgi:hypothetical protein